MSRQLIHTGPAAAVEATINQNVTREEAAITNKGDFKRGTVGTGSTLLDLAISGNRSQFGGVPAGVILEIYGPSSSGKTAVLAELATGVKHKGGVIKFNDPEARLDTTYAQRCGLDLTAGEINRPDTVEELESSLLKWKPTPTVPGAICAQLCDSIAAFSTEIELGKGHKMAAAKRAQAFHQLFRKLGRKIAHEGWIVACSNHEQQNFDTGAKTTPGGNAIKYWASVRIRIAPAFKQREIKRSWKVNANSTIEKTIGILSYAKVVKNSCDDPFHEVPIYIIFGQGIDDIRANLIWLKQHKGWDEYNCIDKSFKMLEPAIRYVEEYNLETQLRDMVVEMWWDINEHFRTDRKPKVRW